MGRQVRESLKHKNYTFKPVDDAEVEQWVSFNGNTEFFVARWIDGGYKGGIATKDHSTNCMWTHAWPTPEQALADLITILEGVC